MIDYLAFMKKYLPTESPDQTSAITAYNIAYLTALLLERSGNDLTRENLLRQATSMKDVELPMALPGVKVNISSENRFAIRQVRLARFDGVKWQMFGNLIGAE